MTDRSTFEAKLANAYERYLLAAPVDASPLRVARAAMAGTDARVTSRRGIPTWRASARLILAIGLLVIAAAATAVIGTRPVRGPAPAPAFPRTKALIATLSAPVDVRSVLHLHDGRLLVSGYGGGPGLADLIDPRTGAHAAIPSGFPSANVWGAAPLSDGRVLLVGWVDGDPVATGRSLAWLLDPATNEVATTINTLEQRFEPTVVGLADGRVLVAGGLRNPESTVDLASTELFDPSVGAFQPGPDLRSPRMGQVGVALPNGDVLLAGGDAVDLDVAAPVLDVERFSPRTGVSTVVGRVVPGRGRVLGAALVDGRVLLVSGQLEPQTCGRHGIDAVGAQLFDPAASSLRVAPTVAHSVSALVPLSDGRVLVAGAWQAMPGGCGSGLDYVTDNWLGVYDPTAGMLASTRDPITGTGALPVHLDAIIKAGVDLMDGRVAVVEGESGTGRQATVDLLTLDR